MYEDNYKQFLLDLDAQKNKEIYARITALTFAELPVETIEGRVTGGSINIDGASAIRRSCSLTISAQNFTYNHYYWGLNSKFKLEIGIKNNINSMMPDIIWFNQGIYLITTFNTSNATNAYNISISGKDKMCLLNGEIGGTLESSVDFGTIEEEDSDGVWKIRKIPVMEIIRNMVHTYAGEPYYNIIINDLDTYGLELLEYRYDVPMYLYRRQGTDVYHNMVMENDDLTLYLDSAGTQPVKLKEIDIDHLDILVEPPGGISHEALPLYFKSPYDGSKRKPYLFAKVEYGQTAGYRISDLIYPGDLVANPGESITSVLDKLKSMLTEFEYFYDLDGHFVFQKKKSFISTMWSPLHNDENNEDSVQQSLALATSTAYAFNNNESITAFNNNPNLLNLRNDYSIWGERTGTSGAKLPIHMRYAIDKKPKYYKNFKGEIFVTGKEVFQELEYTTTQEIFKEYFDTIQAFQPVYPQPDELKAPMKRADGSWTAGWWDIRDWATYYKILTATTEEPPYTMKWYSTGDETGYQKLTLSTASGSLDWTGYVWLVIRKKSQYDNSYYYHVGHGGTPESWFNPNAKETCTLYRSYYDDKGRIRTVTALDENNQPITKEFGPPYSGCTDTHTYLKFLTEDTSDTASVYFYNPAFPSHDSYEQLVTEVATKYYEENGLLHYVDWREIIYQMSLDYYQHNTEDNFELDIIKNNPIFYPSGQTGYERYYIDLAGFWRQIYYPFLNKNIAETEKERITVEALIASTKDNIKTLTQDISNLNAIEEPTEEQTLQLIEAVEILKTEENNLRKLEIELDNLKDKLDNYYKLIENYFYYSEDLFMESDDVSLIYKGVVSSYYELLEKTGVQLGHYYLLTTETTYNDITYHVGDIFVATEINDDGTAKWENGLYEGEKQFWLKNVYERPESLNFWFDFLDTEGELQQFNVKNIGSRSKTVNETSIKSIYFRRTPAVVFTNDINNGQRINSYKYLQIPEQYIEQMFTTSAQGKSAKDRLDELLYAHGYCVETVTITALPVYYLDVNTRIYVHDDKSGIDGDYVVSKITIPLTYNGTMSINATKAAENILN